MSTWKKLLTEDDGNLGSANQSVPLGSSRDIILGTDGTLFQTTQIRFRWIDEDDDEKTLFTVGAQYLGNDNIFPNLTAFGHLNIKSSSWSTGTRSSLKLFEATDDGSFFVGLQASASDMTADYSLSFPAAGPSANTILESDSSGNLSWISTPGGVTINNAAADRLVTVASNTDELDAESSLTFKSEAIQGTTVKHFNADSTVFCITSNGSKPTGWIHDSSGEYGDDGLDQGDSNTAHAVSGEMLSLKHSSTSITAGKFYYLNTSNGLSEGHADTEADAKGMMMYCNLSRTSATTSTLLLRGIINIPNTSLNGTFNEGAILYLANGVGGSGELTFTIPNTSGHIVRIMGYGIRRDTSSTNTVIYFNPSPDYLQIA